MSRSQRRQREVFDPNQEEGVVFDLPVKTKRVAPLEAQTPAQRLYINSIIAHTLTFGVGPAGTGKTFVCGALAAEELKAKRIEKIILTRPAVEAGESLGFLPGELDEKFEPFFRPFRDVLVERLGQGYVECAIKNKKIEALPLAYMRGTTLKNAWVILDEAQNTTPLQMKMFLTRIGEGAKFIVNGDVSQVDIPGRSGLVDALHKLRGLEDTKEVTFTKDDIVRHGLVQRIVERYEDGGEEAPEAGVLRTLGERRG